MKSRPFPPLAATALLLTLTCYFLGCGNSQPKGSEGNSTTASTSPPATPESAQKEDSTDSTAWIDAFRKMAPETARLEFITEKLVTAPDDLDIVIATALADPSAAIRQAAMGMIDQLPADKAAPILISASHDNDGFVRSDAINAIHLLPSSIRLKTLATALGSPHPSTRSEIISLIANDRSKPAVELMFQSLDDSDTTVRTTAATQIESLLAQEFESAKKAISWWEAHRLQFDDKLRRISK